MECSLVVFWAKGRELRAQGKGLRARGEGFGCEVCWLKAQGLECEGGEGSEVGELGEV